MGGTHPRDDGEDPGEQLRKKQMMVEPSEPKKKYLRVSEVACGTALRM